VKNHPAYMTRIRFIRKQQGWTLKKLAFAMETTPQTIQRLEVDNMTMSLEWLHSFAKVLRVTPADLLTEQARPATPDDVMFELARSELVRARRDPREHSALALLEANGQLATAQLEAHYGLRQWSDVTKAAATAAACAIRIALDGEPGRVAVAPPVLVSSREDVA